MEWPIITKEDIYHVGTLNNQDKQRNSHEGDGLSISTHPRAWERINPFTTGKTFLCVKPNNQFLDKHALNEHQLDRIVAWGLEKNWVEPCVYYRVTYYDSEWDEEFWMTFRTKEEADCEVEGMAHDDDNLVSVVDDGIQMTKQMQKKMHCTEQELDPWDKLIVLYSEYALHIDGVWWDDTLSPHQYSAPRGVIVPSRLNEWTFTVQNTDKSTHSH